MKKLLFILPSFGAGGAENYLLRFLPYIGPACRVYVMAPENGGTELLPAFQHAGCTTILDSIGSIGLFNSTRFLRLLRKEKFAAVCTLTGTFGGWPLFLSWLAGVPTRIGWHRRSSNAFKANTANLTYNNAVKFLLERFATQVLSNSATALDFFHGSRWKSNGRYRVVQNGVAFHATMPAVTPETAKQELGYGVDDFVIGHVGRFDPAKNHPLMMAVAARMRNTHPRVKFLFCGKGTDSDTFHQLLAKHGLQRNCRGIGLHQHPAEVYKALDIFFFPSVTEGQPNALIEAAGAGLPLLASNIDAIKEATPDWFHDRLIAPHDAPAFAAVIERLYKNREEAAGYRLTDYARRRYDLKHNMVEFKNLLVC